MLRDGSETCKIRGYFYSNAINFGKLFLSEKDGRFQVSSFGPSLIWELVILPSLLDCPYRLNTPFDSEIINGRSKAEESYVPSRCS